MKQCRQGHQPYPATKAECPGCVRARKRRQMKQEGPEAHRLGDRRGQASEWLKVQTPAQPPTQSSPAPEDGRCNPPELTGILVGRRGFNPRPPQRTGAAKSYQIERGAKSTICFNPRPPQRTGAAPSGECVAVKTWRKFELLAHQEDGRCPQPPPMRASRRCFNADFRGRKLPHNCTNISTKLGVFERHRKVVQPRNRGASCYIKSSFA